MLIFKYCILDIFFILDGVGKLVCRDFFMVCYCVIILYLIINCSVFIGINVIWNMEVVGKECYKIKLKIR